MIKKNINIVISYKFQDNNSWYHLNLKIQDYYDKEYFEKDEDIDIDSLPLYDHAVDYISIEDISSIKITKLCITDDDTKEKITIKESYWNSQKNSVVERTDLDSEGTISNHEIIVTTIVLEDSEKKVWEIMRFLEIEQIFNAVFHSFITEDAGKFISEEIVSTV